MSMMILGIGGMGIKIARQIRDEASNPLLTNAIYTFTDTDKKDLYRDSNPTDKIIEIKKHSFWQVKIKELNPFPKELFTGVSTLIIISGLGGKTGTEYAKKAAVTARNAKVPDIRLFLTTPWHFEGDKKIKTALSSLEDLKDFKLEIFNNESLTSEIEDDPDMDFQTKLNYINKIIIDRIINSINND